MTGLLLALANPLLVAIQNALAKKNLRANTFSDNAIVFARLFYVVPIFIVAMLLFGIPSQINSNFWILICVMIAAEVPSQIAFHKAIKFNKMAEIMPIVAFLAPLLLLTSLILEPEVNWKPGQFIGIGLISLSVYLSSFKGTMTLSNLFSPIQRILHEKGFQLMLITVLLWVVTTHLQQETILALGENTTNYSDQLTKVFFMGSIYLFGASFGVILVGSVFNKESIGSITTPKGFWKLIPIGVIAGVASVAQYGSLFYIEESIMIALKETLIIWAVLLDTLFFKQKANKKQAFSVIMVTIGSIIMILY